MTSLRRAAVFFTSASVMPFCRSNGIHTWIMRPANAKIRAANHCFLCDMTIGAARLIHDLVVGVDRRRRLLVTAQRAHRDVGRERQGLLLCGAAPPRHLTVAGGRRRRAGSARRSSVLLIGPRPRHHGSPGLSRVRRHGLPPQLERAQRHRLLLGGQATGQGGEVLVDGLVGGGQDLLALVGQAHGDPPAVAVLLATVDQPAGHEAVHDRRDARAPDGQAVGQAGGGGRALGQDAEHPELGQGQVDAARATSTRLASQAATRP